MAIQQNPSNLSFTIKAEQKERSNKVKAKESMGKKSRTKDASGSPKKSTLRNANLKTLETLNRLSRALIDLDETKNTKELSSDVASSDQELQPGHENNLSSEKAKTNQTSLPLSHYKDNLPRDVETSYQMMQDGASLIHSTSTKYTLLGKINAAEGSKLTEELLKGAQFICTGVILLFSEEHGCGRSCRYYAKRSARAVIASVIGLVTSFVDGDAIMKKNLGAQKTGAVWSTCDEIINKKVPRGNRAAMRRDLFTWIKECQETNTEFQDILDVGPQVEEGDKDKEGSDGWDSFCENDGGEQYTKTEYTIAKPALALIQITKGTIQCVIKACECIGEHAATQDISPIQKSHLLLYLSKLHDLSRNIGEGMTDLGALLYPPLDVGSKNNELFLEVMAHSINIMKVCDWILDERILLNEDKDNNDSIEVSISEEILDFTKKIKKITKVRTSEAEKALSAAIL